MSPVDRAGPTCRDELIFNPGVHRASQPGTQERPKFCAKVVVSCLFIVSVYSRAGPMNAITEKKSVQLTEIPGLPRMA